MKRLRSRVFDWELWPFVLIYAPLYLVWLYYIIKARAVWFFSTVNPTLTFSGFEGEGKREMYEQLPEQLYPETIYIASHEEPIDITCRIKEAGISFPFIVKPDVGTQGLMFRKIQNVNQLLSYHACIQGAYLIQSLVELPEEYSVFYVRYPGEKNGKITGLILKEYLSVTGDGQSSLLQLMEENTKAQMQLKKLSEQHKDHLPDILPMGTVYYLSIAGNHNRGARFTNLHYEIDEQLRGVFDRITDAVPMFQYGRYDIKCTSLPDLKQGNNIQILEYNGTGAEPNHIYDCGMSYGRALRVIVQHWEDMYRIGKINRRQGIPYWNAWQGRKHLRKTYRWYKTLRQLDATVPL